MNFDKGNFQKLEQGQKDAIVQLGFRHLTGSVVAVTCDNQATNTHLKITNTSLLLAAHFDTYLAMRCGFDSLQAFESELHRIYGPFTFYDFFTVVEFEVH